MSSSRPSRVGKKTCRLYSLFTGTQQSRSVQMTNGGAEFGGDMHTGSSFGAGTTTSSRIDSEGRIYVHLSPNYDQFVGAYPTPGKWIGEYWRRRVFHEFWPSFKKLPNKEKENIWEAFKLKYTWEEVYEEATIKTVFMNQCRRLFTDHIDMSLSLAIRLDAQYILRIETLEARLAEEQRLAAEYQEQADRRFAELVAMVQSMAQQMHGFSNTSSSSTGSLFHSRNLFQDQPPPPPPPL